MNYRLWKSSSLFVTRTNPKAFWHSRTHACWGEFWPASSF